MRGREAHVFVACRMVYENARGLIDEIRDPPLLVLINL